MQHRFTLDKSPKKFKCPKCGKRRFVLYVDHETGGYLSDLVGRCDRESNCQHHYTPKAYFEDNPAAKPNPETQTDLFNKPGTPPPPPQDLSFIPPEILHQTLKEYDKNNFVKFLHFLFDADVVNGLVELFKIGTSKKRWAGATVFWQVDTELKVRQAKVMLYDPGTGKRVKEDSEPEKGKPKIYFAGKTILARLGIESPELHQCFFGEHQLSRKDAGQIVAIVESEKTAILMAAFSKLGFAENFVWLATGGKNGARWTEPQVFKALVGKDVVLFPDLGAYDEWKTKSAKLTGCRVTVSDFLEKNAPEKDRKDGLDIADYYLEAYRQSQRESDANHQTPENNDRTKLNETPNNEARPIEQPAPNPARCQEPTAKAETPAIHEPKGEKLTQNSDPVFFGPALDKAQMVAETSARFDLRPSNEPAKAGKHNSSPAHSPTVIETPERFAQPEKALWHVGELEAFFEAATLPPGPIQLKPFGKITDPPRFIRSHIDTLKAHNGNKTFEPYLRRLEALKAFVLATMPATAPDAPTT